MVPFSFLPTETELPEQRNWRTFDEKSKLIVRTDLVFTNGTDITIPAAYFQLYGPIVFYNIRCHVPDTKSWTTTAYIDLPYNAANDRVAFQAGHPGLIIINGAEAFIGWAYISGFANPNRLNLAAGYTNSSGAAIDVNIQGWYFRGN